MALYCVDADLELQLDDGAAQTLPARTMGVLPVGQGVQVRAHTPARWVVVGGAPLDGPRHIWWNFVSSRKERIVQAAQDWEAQAMGQVPGETEWIALPPRRFKP